jgi:hypothetical protein
LGSRLNRSTRYKRYEWCFKFIGNERQLRHKWKHRNKRNVSDIGKCGYGGQLRDIGYVRKLRNKCSIR